MRYADKSSEAAMEVLTAHKVVVPVAEMIRIIGLRCSSKSAKFDDLVGVVAKFGGKIYVRLYPATTDPGIPYLKNPINSLGTAIVPSGWHKAIWRKGLHKGKYSALVQTKPISLWRDNNKNFELDPENLYDHKRSVGINLHRASQWWGSRKMEELLQLSVGRWSAGCQVIASATHFEYLMWFVGEARQRYFDYHLIDNTKGQVLCNPVVDEIGRLIF